MLSSKAINDGTESINKIIAVGVFAFILLFEKLCPIEKPRYVNTKPIGAAIIKHIMPSQANAKSPMQKTKSVQYELLRSSFLETAFLWARINVDVAPKTKGSQMKSPKA